MNDCITPLITAGIAHPDAVALRRISMTLHRWHELECGDGNASGSWVIERGRKAAGVFTHDESGAPYMAHHSNNRPSPTYTKIADKERGAKKRLAAIMARYPTLSAYIQGDPRGAALYIIRPGDVPEGATVDSCYSRGAAVYK